MIVYFSATGNSRYCADYLAEQLGDETLDIFHYLRSGIAADLVSGRPWVFVSPVYAWRLPRVFEQFLRSGSFSGSEDAYFVITCGNEIGNAPKYVEPLCREIGLRYRGTREVVMAENYIAMFSAPGPEENRRILAAAMPGLAEGAACIREGRDFPGHRAGLLDRFKSAVVNPCFYPMFVKAKGFRAESACIGCGRCESVCPLGNIRMEADRPVWGDRCTHCMACICGCPTETIEYGRSTRGKVRYRCPEYRV